MGQGFSIELIITFSFVLSIFALVDTERTDVAGSVPMAVGFSIALCHLLAVSTYTEHTCTQECDIFIDVSSKN